MQSCRYIGGEPVATRGVFYDITDRRRSEELIKQLYEREKKLRQEIEVGVERRSEYTRALVHELKTPITSILVASGLLADELREEFFYNLAQNIQRSASTLNSRIDTLLDLARGELGMLELKYSHVDILKLIHKVADTISPVALSRGLSLVLDVPSSLPLIWADEERLGQVILNLLTNSYNWSPEGGEVALRAKEEEATLIVEVEDSGAGIAKRDQQRIFEAYYRGSSKGQRIGGLGLGLALCKAIVEAHGGRIWVESEKGKGSTFSFSIPLLADVD